jgi:type III restriction enzyme
MSWSFFERPILNSPYEVPAWHHPFDENGRPTGGDPINTRRRADLITPVPRSRRQRARGGGEQSELVLANDAELSSAEQAYNPTPIINEIRQHVDAWRALPNPAQWGVTPPTQRLLQHWREHEFQGFRPFFCQREAVETIIWLTEVASKSRKTGRRLWGHVEGVNEAANPELLRLAMKMATGSGKTTVMAMLIAWQTVNAVRQPRSNKYSRGFLVVTPGITIRDRLQVLRPDHPESYYQARELVPADMLADVQRAKIVIANYHAFKRREEMSLPKVDRALLKGRDGAIDTLETEGRMLQRVMPDLMGLKNIVVINDEAHHCYREKPGSQEVDELKGEEKDEAKENNEAARLWITGIETVQRHLGVRACYDLSATPFFLRGSGYAEGTLFPWTVSDFSLLDAIECGIVKLPRIPVSDNLPDKDLPLYRNLWDHIGKRMPRKGRGRGIAQDPRDLPTELETAIQALYGHYKETFELWETHGVEVPPVFIVVCNNTATSKLVHDYIAGFKSTDATGAEHFHNGRLELFRNFDEFGNPLARPRTLLIDSQQLESGEALDPAFRSAAAPEIARFKRELVEQDPSAAEKEVDDARLLREVMNTVGKKGRLGESVRCVVSVSLLTEGWDVNTVTHILGVRAFGTALLCEQVVGRALRRQSYDLNEEGLFNAEYADILGIPFDFAAKPVVAPPARPKETVRVEALRDRVARKPALEIRFPRIEGYRVELPNERLTARFDENSVLELTPELVGPCEVLLEGIVGESNTITVDHLKTIRYSTIVYNLASNLLMTKFRDPGGEPKNHLFGQLKRVVRQWLDGGYLVCKGETNRGMLMYKAIADQAAERIRMACEADHVGSRPVLAIPASFNPVGSTNHVAFTTSKDSRYETGADKSHVNYVICDSQWEAEFARVAEAHPRVIAYVKNQSLGFEVPYRDGGTPRRYVPDFIVKIDDGHGSDDPLHLVVEVKGFRNGDAQLKAETMTTRWVPGVNRLGTYGRWDFVELRDAFEMKKEFGEVVESLVSDGASVV